MSLKIFSVNPQNEQETNAKLPSWFRQEIPSLQAQAVKKILSQKNLNTVCVGAACPNQGACWGQGVATFMILGSHCTRHCRFCAVPSGETSLPDPEEPARIAQAVSELGLKYVVITSVTRDDLKDQGVGQFIKTVEAIKQRCPQTKVECLTPDFNNDVKLLMAISNTEVDVLSHNMETVKRIYSQVRPESDYQRALDVLANYKELNPKRFIKSGFMVGLGESQDEVVELMGDLHLVDCDILTIGQYLSPTSGREHVGVKRFWTPEEFVGLKQIALKKGFRSVASGPLVRSSFLAEEVYRSANK